MPCAKNRLRRIERLLLSCAVLATFVVGAARVAVAQVGSDRYSSMVVDAQSGAVLEAANPDEYRFPASLTKMMTIYLLFEAVRDHRISFSDAVPVSAWAASMPPTKLGLMPGTYITVEQCVLGLVTRSANDAAAALGELMGGDEERFAQMMTLRARSLGMSHTTFRNASGLPDWGQVTTARDMVVLARHLIQDFPAYYHYFSTPFFQFRGRMILNHQHLLQTYPGTDGLKTGYTDASGYNLVVSTVRGDVRLIGVVMGAGSGGERDAHMAGLLDQGFLREGVPIELARRETPAYHLPFVTMAHAATQSWRQAPVQVVAARLGRYREHRFAFERPSYERSAYERDERASYERPAYERHAYERPGAELRTIAARHLDLRAVRGRGIAARRMPIAAEESLSYAPMRSALARAALAGSGGREPRVIRTRTAHRMSGGRYPG